LEVVEATDTEWSRDRMIQSACRLEACGITLELRPSGAFAAVKNGVRIAALANLRELESYVVGCEQEQYEEPDNCHE
jgi:hypothetical protein